MRRIIYVCILAGIVACGAFACGVSAQAAQPPQSIQAAQPVQPAQTASDSALTPTLQNFVREGGKVHFIGHAYGLDGFLVEEKGHAVRTVYTTPEGGMVIGLLVGPDGTVKTTDQLMAYKARMEGSQEALAGADKAIGVSPAEQFYAAVEKAAWVAVGKKDAPYIYMFMNVNCDHCQNEWKDLQPAIAEGRLQVRLVPFGAQSSNRDGGAALLASAAPGQGWNAFIAGNTAVLGKDKATPAGLAGVDSNTKLLGKWKVAATPFTIYRRVTDGTLATVSGRPENVMLILADLIK